MSESSSVTSKPMSALSLVYRLLFARNRDRADLCYEFMGADNCPSPDCKYLNLGYWRTATDYRSAAEAMVDLLADAADIREGDVVIDAGCGFGEQDQRIMRMRRPARISALNVTEVQLAYARQHNAFPNVEYIRASATSLPFEDASIDKVMSLEAAFHFPTRADFLRDAFRVLRPGGRLAVIDLIPLERDGRLLTGGLRGSIERWGHQVPNENVYGGKRYCEIVESMGFRNCVLTSIDKDVVPGFFEFVRKLLADPVASKRLHPMVRKAYERLRSPLGTPFSMSDYILVTADKPVVH